MSGILVLVLVSLLASAIKAELPAYFKVCNRSDPNYTDCLRESFKFSVKALKNGHEDSNIPSLDPFVITSIQQDITILSFKANMMIKNLYLMNLTQFEIIDLSVDGNEYKMDIKFPRLLLKGNFLVNLKMGMKGLYDVQGSFKEVLENLQASCTLKGKLIHVNKKESLEFDDLSVKLTIGHSDITVKLTNNEKKFEFLEKVINTGLKAHENILFQTGRSSIEQIVETKVLSIIKQITFGYKYSELFPK